MIDRLSRAFNFLARRRLAYVRTFRDNAFGEEVLGDLARFCRANESTFHTDPRVHAMIEGRREVWLRITEHLNLSDAELYAMYGTGRPKARLNHEED